MRNRLQKLTLTNPLTYKPKEMEFNAMLRFILLAPVGTDAFIRFRFSFSDSGATFERMESGYKEPLTEKEKAETEAGLRPKIRDGETLSIPVGTYYFEQYPDLSEEKLLTRTLSALLSVGSGDEIYVRLFKENMLECVMQGFRAL